jgi:hypothetical protein
VDSLATVNGISSNVISVAALNKQPGEPATQIGHNSVICLAPTHD